MRGIVIIVLFNVLATAQASTAAPTEYLRSLANTLRGFSDDAVVRRVLEPCKRVYVVQREGNVVWLSDSFPPMPTLPPTLPPNATRWRVERYRWESLFWSTDFQEAVMVEGLLETLLVGTGRCPSSLGFPLRMPLGERQAYLGVAEDIFHAPVDLLLRKVEAIRNLARKLRRLPDGVLVQLIQCRLTRVERSAEDLLWLADGSRWEWATRRILVGREVLVSGFTLYDLGNPFCPVARLHRI